MIHDIALVPEETIYKYLLLIYVNMLHQNGAATRDWRLDIIDSTTILSFQANFVHNYFV